MRDFDSQAEDAMQRGFANLQVMQLAANHCFHMEFWQGPHLGVGIIEQMTGLPIGMRSVECKHVDAGRSTASVHLDAMAIEFYESHCVGCKFQSPSGQFPTLGALVEERKAARAAAQEEQDRAEFAKHELWASRADRRRAMRLDGDAGVVSLSCDLDLIDPDPRANGEVSSSARLRIEAVAAKAPQLFTEPVIDLLFEMVTAVPQGRTLEPLRLLARQRREMRHRLLVAAVARLAVTHDADAGRCLVELEDLVKVADLSDEVSRSIVLLAGAPTQGDFGHFEESTSKEVEPLRIHVRIAPELLLNTLAGMLPGLPAPPILEMPTAKKDLEDKVDSWREAIKRAAAATATSELIATNPDVAAKVFPYLLRNLQRPGDTYDDHPYRAVTQSAADLLVHDGTLLDKLVAHGDLLSDEHELETLFEIVDEAVKTFGPYRDRPTPDEKERIPLLDTAISFSVAVLDGRWGAPVAGAAGRLIEETAKHHPDWAADNYDTLLGALVTARERLSAPAESSPLILPGDAPEFRSAKAMEQFGKSQLFGATIRNLRNAIVNSANAKPTRVVRALLATLDDARSSPTVPAVPLDLLEMLGQITASHGQESGLLNRVLPVLRGYMVDADPLKRIYSMNAWIEVARTQPVPATFQDLLPELLQDRVIGVIQATLRASSELVWTAEDRLKLFTWALGLAESKDTKLQQYKPEVLGALLVMAKQAGGNPEKTALWVLERTLDLPDMDFFDFVKHRRWPPSVANSPELAAVRWREYRVSRHIGLRDEHDERVRELASVGAGLVALKSDEITSLAEANVPDTPWTAMVLSEILWAGHGWPSATRLFNDLLAKIPKETRHSRLRARVQLLADWDGPNGAPIPTPSGIDAQLSSAEELEMHPLFRAYQLRAKIRSLLVKSSQRAPEEVASPAELDELKSSAHSLADEASRMTPSAAYLRCVSEMLISVAHAAFARLAELEADEAGISLHRGALTGRMAELSVAIQERWDPADPLRILLESVSEPFAASGTLDSALVAKLPMPPLFIEGDERRTAYSPHESGDRAEPVQEDVIVAIASLDGRTITGPQVLRPSQVYRLGVTLNIDSWPAWATHLEGELVSDLTSAEITLPSFRWNRPAVASDDEITLVQDGTLICRFTKGPNVPAPRFVLDLKWHGIVDGQAMVQRANVAAHREIQLRPFDATSDALTKNGPFDERLLEVFDKLRAADTDEQQVQAFARLLGGIARASLTIAWSKAYKLGTHITERKFHDDLYQMLLEDPELEGRIERGNAVGLGYNDLRHDGITAELKVEKTVPETKERSAKYISQTAQYASADGTRVSILCVLDMTRKIAVVAPPENYLWVLQPPVHAIVSPQYPPAVAVHVINAWSPSPSSWSRRRAPLLAE